MKKNLRKVFAVSMAGAMVAGCIPAMADEAASKLGAICRNCNSESSSL